VVVIGIVLWVVSELSEIRLLWKGIQTSVRIEKKGQTALKGEEEGVQRPIQISPSIAHEKKTHTAQNDKEKEVQLPIRGENNAPDSNEEFRFCTKKQLVLCKKNIEMTIGATELITTNLALR